MTLLTLKPALEFSIPVLADLLTRSFEEYFVPIQINDAALSTMVRRDSVDLSASRVLLKEGEPAGIALMARRGWVSRLAAMGLVKDARNSGSGTWVMSELLTEARARGDHEMCLEVIEQNEAGVRLYRKSGFGVIRRLVGFVCESPQAESAGELQEIGLREAGQAVTRHGLADLPWQLSGESIANHTPPTRAFRIGSAFAVITNPEVKDVVIYSLLVEDGARGQGCAMRLLGSLFAAFPEKTWHVPALCPEEVGGIFEHAGFQREKLSQHQMSIRL
jgi:GNAT superfamily N-acetyltransferase